MNLHLSAFLQDVADNTVRVYGDYASAANAHLSAGMTSEYMDAVQADSKMAGQPTDLWLELLAETNEAMREHMATRLSLVLTGVGKAFAEGQYRKEQLGELMATAVRDVVRRRVIAHLEQGAYLTTAFETRDRKRRLGLKF